jgi:tetratricopeptide (TPR) repeat protein
MPQSPVKKKSNSAKWIKLTVTIVAAIVVIVIIKYVWERSNQIGEYNKIIDEDINQGKYDDAIPRLQKLVDTAQSSIAKEAKTELAKCYIAQGDKAELSTKQRAEFFKKANDLDPSTLTDMQKTELKLGLAPPPADDVK